MAACLTPAGKQQYKNTFLGQVTDELKKAGIVGPLAGAAAGKIIDNWLTDEDESIPFLWIGGALLGTRQVRGRIKGFVSSKDTPRLPNSPDPDLDDTLREAMRGESVSDAARLVGGVLDPNTASDMGMLTSLKTTLKSAVNSRGSAYDLFTNSRAVKSIYSFLASLPQTAEVKKFRQYIVNMPIYIKRKRYASKDIFNSKYGNGAYDKYDTEELVQKIAQITPEELNSYSPENLSGLLTTVALKGNARLENGRLVLEDFADIRIFADDVPQFRGMLENLMEDQKYVDYLDSMKTGLREFKDEVVSELSRQTDTFRATTLQGNRKILDDLLNTNHASTVFRDSQADKAVRDLFDRALKHDDSFRKAVEIHDKIQRFNIEGYWPQVFSRSKMANLEQKIRASLTNQNKAELQATLKGVEDSKIEKALASPSDENVLELRNEYLFQKMFEANQNNPRIKNQLLFFDEQSKTIQERRFASLTEARNSFLAKIRASALSDAQKETIANNIDKYVVSFDAKKLDGTTQKMYRVQIDDEIIDRLGYNPLTTMNRKQLEKGVILHLNSATVANSNYLDLPRVFEIPLALSETNIQKQLDIYYNDAGRRMYNSINNMFDEEQLTKNYIDPINQTIAKAGYDQPMQDLAKKRILSAYNVANNTYGKTIGEVKQNLRNQKMADIITSAFFARYFVSIGGYNFFEPLVVGPLITGVRSFGNVFVGAFSKRGKAEIEALEQKLADWGVSTGKLRSINPGMDVLEVTNNPHTLIDQAHATSNNISNKLANFALIADSIKGLTGSFDIERGGVLRMGFGSFVSSNKWNTAMIVKSGLEETDRLAKIYNQLKALPEGERVQIIEGKRYTMGDIKRRMEGFGINETQLDDFATRNSNYREALDVVFDKSRTLGEVDKTLSDYIKTIAQTVTDNFHGTGIDTRPDLWRTPTGRLMSMYSTYANNFGLQNLQRRIRLPIRDWNANHGNRLNIGGTSLEHLYHFKRGNFDKLRALGFDNAAIDDFPLEAYAHITKLMMAMGISVGGFMTRAVIDDLMAYPLRDANEQEQWVRTRRAMIVNPLAPPNERKTWGDLQNEFEVIDVLNVIMGSASIAAQGAAFGRYSDIISSNYFIRQDGILALTPVTSEVNQWFKSFAGMVQTAGTNPGNLPNELGRNIINNGANWLPYVGSWPFSGFTNAALNWETQQGRVKGAQMNDININIKDISL